MCIALHRKCIKCIAYHNISNLKQFHSDALSNVRLKDVEHVFEMHSVFVYNFFILILEMKFLPNILSRYMKKLSAAFIKN